MSGKLSYLDSIGHKAVVGVASTLLDMVVHLCPESLQVVLRQDHLIDSLLSAWFPSRIVELAVSRIAIFLEQKVWVEQSTNPH